MDKGVFITFEGGEGTGKTTLIHRLEKDFQSRGLPVVRTREPGGTQLSEHIRGWLLDKSFNVPVGDKAEMLLFLAARVQHLEELILPSLEKGKIVLCDRFNDSTIIYQGLGRGLGFDFAAQLCDLVCAGLRPDLTLILDVDPVIGLTRTRQARKENAQEGETDRIEGETLSFHERIREGFLAIARNDSARCKVVDASQSIEQVYTEALAIALESLKAHRDV